MTLALIAASAALVVALLVVQYARARANRRYEDVLRRLDEELEPISRRLEDAVERSSSARGTVGAGGGLTPSVESLLQEIADGGAAVRAFRHVAHGVAPEHDAQRETAGQYEAELERKIAGARRTGRPLALVLLDLDPLPESPPELQLAELAALLESVTRSTDAVCRSRPDELGILLSETTAEGARRFHVRLRDELAKRGVSQTPPPTFSAGIVEWQRHETGAAFDARARAAVRRTTARPLEAVD